MKTLPTLALLALLSTPVIGCDTIWYNFHSWDSTPLESVFVRRVSHSEVSDSIFFYLNRGIGPAVDFNWSPDVLFTDHWKGFSV